MHGFRNTRHNSRAICLGPTTDLNNNTKKKQKEIEEKGKIPLLALITRRPMTFDGSFRLMQ